MSNMIWRHYYCHLLVWAVLVLDSGQVDVEPWSKKELMDNSQVLKELGVNISSKGNYDLSTTLSFHE